MIDLFLGHDHVENSAELLDLLLLVANGIEEFLLFDLMLGLDVF